MNKKLIRKYIKSNRHETIKDTLVFMLESGLCTESDLAEVLTKTEKIILYQECVKDNIVKLNKYKSKKSLLLLEFNIVKNI